MRPDNSAAGNAGSHAKRLICSRCLRPERTCICQWITPVEHSVEVLILQHPMEAGNAKGSARLLHMSLPRSRLVAGEVFAEQELRALLYEPFHAPPAVDVVTDRAVRQPILLYPETPEGTNMGMAGQAVRDAILLQDPAQLRLVVLDGTWRKSRKILCHNPLLQSLPRLALRDPPASQYLIRKAHRPDQLSTLEATCHALMQLEGNQRYQSLLNGFNGFVAQQSGYFALKGETA